eukprot:TRINITY_DN9160_c0_g1_i1.p1 TRINITY_DN9160_c0_g1~~TRINITY_DN9160_c0_g1_i1.p1  ORF type:complete len:592 (-),score=126.91 TRINITY_DN9160_c0_g1_i1:312-2087(-)
MAPAGYGSGNQQENVPPPANLPPMPIDVKYRSGFAEPSTERRGDSKAAISGGQPEANQGGGSQGGSCSGGGKVENIGRTNSSSSGSGAGGSSGNFVGGGMTSYDYDITEIGGGGYGAAMGLPGGGALPSRSTLQTYHHIATYRQESGFGAPPGLGGLSIYQDPGLAPARPGPPERDVMPRGNAGISDNIIAPATAVAAGELREATAAASAAPATPAGMASYETRQGQAPTSLLGARVMFMGPDHIRRDLGVRPFEAMLVLQDMGLLLKVATPNGAAHIERAHVEQAGRHERALLPAATRPSPAAAAAPQAAAPHPRSSSLAIGQLTAADEEQLPDYVADYYRTLARQLKLHRPNVQYMNRQRHIHEGMRAILVDWLVDVHRQFRMRNETLYLTISLLDRYLSRSEVERGRLQLVGVSAMFIGSKFEEIHPPELRDFVYICARAYTREDVISMEARILNLLNWGTCAPTAAHFMPRLTKANSCSEVQEHFVQYLVELALVDYRSLELDAQHVVAAACLLVNRLFRRLPLWPALMADASGFTDVALSEAADRLHELLLDAAAQRDGGQLRAVWSKFAQQKFSQVATLNPLTLS